MSIPLNDQIVARGPFGLVDDGQISGTLHVVQTVQAMYAIPAYVRKPGMFAHVYNGGPTGSLFYLLSDLVTWATASFGGGGGVSLTGTAGLYMTVQTNQFGQVTSGSFQSYVSQSFQLLAGDGLQGTGPLTGTVAPLSLTPSGTAGTYTTVVLDAFGRASSGSFQTNVSASFQFLAGNGLQGSGPLTGTVLPVSLTPSGTAGTYNNVTLDAFGRATSGSNANYMPSGNFVYDTRQVLPGNGLQGGGALNQDLTIGLSPSGSAIVVPIGNQVVTSLTADGFGRIMAVSASEQWVNVRAYGAKGDGVTDDSAAIQAAIDSLRDTGGTVFFPRGEYKCMEAISVTASVAHSYNNITLEGVGYPTSHIFAGTPIGLHNGTYPYSLINFVGRTAGGMQNSGIRKMRVSGYDTGSFAGPIIQFVNSSGCFMEYSQIDTSPVEGIAWNSAVSDFNARLIGNFATHIGGWGAPNLVGPVSAYNVPSNGCFIVGNRSFQCALSIEQTGPNAIIQGNIFEYCGAGTGSTPVWQYCMSLDSTQSGSQLSVQNNIIRFAGQAIAISTGPGSGDSIIDGNILQNVDAGISINNASGVVMISNNLISDVATSGSGPGAAIRHASGTLTSPIIVENNTIEAGPTGKRGYGIISTDGIWPDIVRNNHIIGDVANTVIFGAAATSTGWNIQFIDNDVSPLTTLASGSFRYLWDGNTLYSRTAFPGIDNGTILSKLRASLIYGSGAPAIGTWQLGDTIVNVSPSVNGTMKWICTTAGTPGTWTAIGISSQPSGSYVVLNPNSPQGGNFSVNGSGTIGSVVVSASAIDVPGGVLNLKPAGGLTTVGVQASDLLQVSGSISVLSSSTGQVFTQQVTSPPAGQLTLSASGPMTINTQGGLTINTNGFGWGFTGAPRFFPPGDNQGLLGAATNRFNTVYTFNVQNPSGTLQLSGSSASIQVGAGSTQAVGFYNSGSLIFACDITGNITTQGNITAPSTAQLAGGSIIARGGGNSFDISAPSLLKMMNVNANSVIFGGSNITGSNGIQFIASTQIALSSTGSSGGVFVQPSGGLIVLGSGTLGAPSQIQVSGTILSLAGANFGNTVFGTTFNGQLDRSGILNIGNSSATWIDVGNANSTVLVSSSLHVTGSTYHQGDVFLVSPSAFSASQLINSPSLWFSASLSQSNGPLFTTAQVQFQPNQTGGGTLIFNISGSQVMQVGSNQTIISSSLAVTFPGNGLVSTIPLGLTPSGTAGTYTNPTITMDAFGRIMSASNGASSVGLSYVPSLSASYVAASVPSGNILPLTLGQGPFGLQVSGPNYSGPAFEILSGTSTFFQVDGTGSLTTNGNVMTFTGSQGVNVVVSSASFVVNVLSGTVLPSGTVLQDFQFIGAEALRVMTGSYGVRLDCQTGSFVLLSRIPTGSNAISAVVIDTNATQPNVNNLLQIRNNGVAAFTFAGGGGLTCAGLNGASWDGASAVKLQLGLNNAIQLAVGKPGFITTISGTLAGNVSGSIIANTNTLQIQGTSGSQFDVVLENNVTASFVGFFPCQRFSITLVQGSGGPYKVAWPASFKGLPSTYRGTDHVAPTLTATSGSRDSIFVHYDGVNFLQTEENLNN